MFTVTGITGLSIIGYVVLSLLVNSPPPIIGSGAWAQAAWAQGNAITYTVWACGPHPYHAQLLMGGLTPGTTAAT